MREDKRPFRRQCRSKRSEAAGQRQQGNKAKTCAHPEDRLVARIGGFDLADLI